MVIDRSISADILESLATWRGHPALVELPRNRPSVAFSPRDLEERIMDTARLFTALGIRDRCVVTVFLENSIDFVAVFLALIHIGAVPVPLKLDYRRIELEAIFRNARPQAVISEHDHIDLIKEYIRDLLVVTREQGRLKTFQEGKGRPRPAELSPEIASINYTYRGHGYPLGALISHEQYRHGARVFQDGLQGRAGEKMLVILPMTHIFTLIGCIFVPLLHQMTPMVAHTLNPGRLLQCMEEHGIDHATAVPEIYQMLWRFRRSMPKLSSLKVFTSGGSALSGEAYQRIVEAFHVEVLHGYGLTELTPASRNVRGRARSGTIGPLCRGVDCRISSGTGTDETDSRHGDPGEGEPGEILIRSPHMARGYYNRPCETGEAFADGWFRTGDIGRMDDNHLVFLRESKKTRKANGNMIDLNEVKRAFLQCSEVQETDVTFEDNTLRADVILRSGTLDREGVLRIKDKLKTLIAPYKIPRVIAERSQSAMNEPREPILLSRTRQELDAHER